MPFQLHGFMQSHLINVEKLRWVQISQINRFVNSQCHSRTEFFYLFLYFSINISSFSFFILFFIGEATFKILKWQRLLDRESPPDELLNLLFRESGIFESFTGNQLSMCYPFFTIIILASCQLFALYVPSRYYGKCHLSCECSLKNACLYESFSSSAVHFSSKWSIKYGKGVSTSLIEEPCA